jgi:hypothetical protein
MSRVERDPERGRAAAPHEHSKREGGHRDVENVNLAHRLCNRSDYSISVGRAYARDLGRIRNTREEAIRRNNERP